MGAVAGHLEQRDVRPVGEVDIFGAEFAVYALQVADLNFQKGRSGAAVAVVHRWGQAFWQVVKVVFGAVERDGEVLEQLGGEFLVAVVVEVTGSRSAVEQSESQVRYQAASDVLHVAGRQRRFAAAAAFAFFRTGCCGFAGCGGGAGNRAVYSVGLLAGEIGG